jgi:adenylate cyclase
MSKATQIKFRQLGTIIIGWLVVGIFLTMYDHLVLLTSNSAGLSPQYSLISAASQHLVSAVVGGMIGGSLLVFYLNARYNEKPYWQLLLV